MKFTPMKKCVGLLLVALSLTGCCSTVRVTQWEYKVARLPRGGDANREEGPEALRAAEEALLNDLGKQGWVFISQTDGRIFDFKRAVR